MNVNSRNSVGDCRWFIVSAQCYNCSRQSNGVWNFKITRFDTSENMASKVSNFKFGWRCQGIFDTLVTLLEPLVRMNLLYDKPTIVSLPHKPYRGVRLAHFARKNYAYATSRIWIGKKKQLFCSLSMLMSLCCSKICLKRNHLTLHLCPSHNIPPLWTWGITEYECINLYNMQYYQIISKQSLST